jgi:hypothetical protein
MRQRRPVDYARYGKRDSDGLSSMRGCPAAKPSRGAETYGGLAFSGDQRLPPMQASGGTEAE